MRARSRLVCFVCFPLLGLVFAACADEEGSLGAGAGGAQAGASAARAGSSGASVAQGGTASGGGAAGTGGAAGLTGAAGAVAGQSGTGGAAGKSGASGAPGQGGASGGAGQSGTTGGAGESGTSGGAGLAGLGGTGGTGGAGEQGGAGAGGIAGSGAAGTGAGMSGAGGAVGATPSCEPASGSAGGKLELIPGTAKIPAPLLVKNAPGDDRRLFVVQKSGAVRILRDGVLVDTPFYTVPSLESGGERGLLGMAFHPGYATNGRYFLHYSRKNDGATVIEERVRGANPDVADEGVGKTVLVVTQPEANHNGGSIEFGADGFLYIALGDGGGGGDVHGPIGNGQNRDTLLGKILRLDIDPTGGGTPYAIPPGNLEGANTRPEIWDYGLRNPYRISFDVCTGDLYIGDVGQGKWEEIDFEPKGEGRRNYGWRAREGSHCYDAALCTSDAPQEGMIDPVVEYGHADGRCSITGGYVYRGSLVPALRGTYFYGDYCSHQIFTTRVVGGVASAPVEVTAEIGATSIGNIFSFGQDNAGELYVATSNGIYRLEAAP